jgi:hypothetical protein
MIWKLLQGKRVVGFVRGSKAQAVAAVQRLADRSGQRVGIHRNPVGAPKVGEIWRGIHGDRCRIVKVKGSQITVLQLDSGHRVTSHLSDFLATYKLSRSTTAANPKRKGRNPRRTNVRNRRRSRGSAGTVLGRGSTSASRHAQAFQSRAAGAGTRRAGPRLPARTASGRFVKRRGPARARTATAHRLRANARGRNPSARETSRQVDALLKRARMLFDQGKKTEAQRVYEQAWGLAPSPNPKGRKRTSKGRFSAGLPRGRRAPRRAGHRPIRRRKAAARSNPRSALAGARAMAKMWHDSPRWAPRARKVKVPPRPKALAALGDLVSVVYRSNKYAGTPDNPSGRPQLHEHRTKRPHPVLAADPDGHIHIVGGRMVPTADGLVN